MKAGAVWSRVFFAAGLLSLLATTAGCHSYHIDTTIENRSGAPVQLLEVDYPSASFGVDALAAGAQFHYRFDVIGSGPVTIQYTGANRQAVKKTGPTLYERQEGRLDIVLLPGGQVEFRAQVTSHS
jgi:hypothetical protein